MPRAAPPPTRPPTEAAPTVDDAWLDAVLAGSAPASAGRAPELVDALLRLALATGASDLHLLPTADAVQVRLRVDGVLRDAGAIAGPVAANVVQRLKVLANLLTYETQTPQEGRLRHGASDRPVRVSTFPTLFGEKLVARLLPGASAEHAHLAGLGLPQRVEGLLAEALRATSGVVLVVGPVGSGKTTTAYALAREAQRAWGGGRAVASIEDPVEVVLPGVAQSQVAPHVGFDLAAGLRSLVRQDPDVVLIGEVRDAPTAQTAFQAGLIGQLILSTFHAGDAAGAVARLLDMGVPPYMVRGALRVVVAQRLVRRLCGCVADRAAPSPVGAADCPVCRGAGYHGRAPIAEGVDFTQEALQGAIGPAFDRRAFAALVREHAAPDLGAQAQGLVESGVTSRAEVDRVLGCEP